MIHHLKCNVPLDETWRQWINDQLHQQAEELEELDKALAAVMAYHCKAGDPVFSAILRYDIDESPVHLETFTGACRISPASVPLWSDKLSFGRDEIKVVPDISFYSRPASGISFFPDPFE